MVIKRIILRLYVRRYNPEQFGYASIRFPEIMLVVHSFDTSSASIFGDRRSCQLRHFR
jgi:hypothetical protein